MDLLQWVQKILQDRGHKKYGLYPHLVTILPSTSAEFIQQNDYYFVANAFTNDSRPITGEIIAADDALSITPAIMQTKVYKHQHFQGKIRITNLDAVSTMYVELLIASPKLSE